MSDFVFISIIFLSTILVTSLIHHPILVLAKNHDLYDNPDKRKLQRRPIPVLGGFNVFISILFGIALYCFKGSCYSLLPTLIAMVIMLLVGFWDDIKKLSPGFRFVVEVVVVVALALFNGYSINDFHGLFGINEIPPLIAWPLTVIACVGIINAFNMVDGIDGLASGFGIMVFSIYGVVFYRLNDLIDAVFSISIVGALIPFYILNVFGEKSKMYLGDSGTMMLGIALCSLVMNVLHKDSAVAIQLKEQGFCIIAFVLAVFAIPIFDTIRVMFGRISRGESPFHPDMTHLHHAFINYGFHHLEASLLEILLNIIIIIIWWLFYKSKINDNWQFFSVCVTGVGVSFGLFYMLGRRKRIADKILDKFGVSMEEYEQLTYEKKKEILKTRNAALSKRGKKS